MWTNNMLMSVGESELPQLIAIGRFVAPFLKIYEQSGQTLTSLTDPSSQPASVVSALAWTNDGDYLAVGFGMSPYLLLYKRNGKTLVKMSDPPSAGGSVSTLSWTKDGTFLAAGTRAAPFFAFYERSGDSLTKLPNPSPLPGKPVLSADWDSTGTYLAITGRDNKNPPIIVYKRTGSSLSKIPDPPDTLHSSEGIVVLWNNTSNFLTLVLGANPYIEFYKRSGTTFSKKTSPLPVAYIVANAPTWSRNDKNYGPYQTQQTTYIYDYANGVFTELSLSPQISLMTDGYILGSSWDISETYLAILIMDAQQNDTFRIYERNGMNLVELSQSAGWPNSLYACAYIGDG